MANENKLISVGVLKEYHNNKVVPALAEKADKSTTLSGYGITDAKIADGVITLGSNTITPLTTHQDITGKQDVISDLEAIRTGAAAGATAYQKADTGIPKSDLASDVQTSLGLADTALQKHQDITGKADLVDGVVKADQLQLKTINGVSVKGTGDITIDLSLYKMVETLPEALVEGNLNPEINMDKIYLVESTSTGTSNIYTEYVFVNTGTEASPSYSWEKLGEYKSDVDLAPYFKTADITEGNGLSLSEGKLTMSVATTSAAGAMSAADKTKLDGLEVATWAELEAVLNAAS